MRKLLRYRIRTLLIAGGVVAAVLAIGPRLWWRWKVNSALEATVATGPDFYWEFDPLASNTRDNYAYLLSDHERVLNRLMAIAQTDDSYRRRVNALKAIRALSSRAGSFEVRKQLLPQLITLACESGTPPSVTAEVAETVGDWIPATGVTIEERVQIHRKAAASHGEERIAWIGVLDAIGGRREVELLLQFGDSHDDAQLWAVYNSQFRGITWPGMLPHLDRWIHDPIIADKALEFSALSQTPGGRDLLLKLVSDDSQPTPTRAKAIEQLTQTVAGIDLLTSACADDALASKLSKLLNVNCRQHLATELRKVRNRNGDELWNELIQGLDPSYWIPTSGVTIPSEVEAQYTMVGKRNARLSLECIRLLAGNANLTTQNEWQSWFQTASPKAVEQSTLLQLLLNHPEMVENLTILRRVVPYHLGYIPGDCLPLYEQMLRSGEPTIQYWACQALLAYTDSDDAVDVAIGLIDQSTPSDATSVHSGAIAMLQRRFAVNYFWDTDAWRMWAKESRSSVNEDGSETRRRTKRSTGAAVGRVRHQISGCMFDSSDPSIAPCSHSQVQIFMTGPEVSGLVRSLLFGDPARLPPG